MSGGSIIAKARQSNLRAFIFRPLGLLSALLFVTSAQSANLVQAITAYDAGDQTQAYGMFEDLALDGHARAAAWMGYLAAM